MPIIDTPPAIECRYTVDEIDRMRYAYEILIAPHCSVPDRAMTDPTGFTTSVEQTIRTYMLGCVQPEELEAKMKAYRNSQVQPCK